MIEVLVAIPVADHKSVNRVSVYRSPASRNWLTGCAGLCWFVSLLVGCGTDANEIPIVYGRQRGKAATSVNGVSVLAEMFRQQGHDVDRYKKLSPRIDRYETLVWFPDDPACPSSEVVDRIEQWLAEGYQRTFVYVGRDYDSQLHYFRMLAESLEGEQQEKALRELAEAELQQDQRRWDKGDYWSWHAGERESCRWYKQESVVDRANGAVTGQWVASLPETISPQLASGTRLVPQDEYLESDPERELNVLLERDGHPFVFAYQDAEYDVGEAEEEYYDYQTSNKIIFVENGSFLLNYGLAHADNRLLANTLIDECSFGDDVLFLESDASGIRVSDSEYDSHDTWAWIAQPPLSYMVPHFMMWGILFCFVFFPIFGRPRRIPNDQHRSFGDHIAAIGRLLSRQQSVAQARIEIQKYKDNVGGDATDKR